MPMGHFLPLTELTARTGRKSCSLGILARQGFPVPEGFCLPSGMYDRIFQQYTRVSDFHLLPSMAKREKLEELRSFIDRCIPERDLDDEIAGILAELGGTVIARSSALEEDGANYSFAGIYRSIGNLKTAAQVIEAVKSIWSSLWSERAFVYREERDISHHSAHMSVILQQEIPGEVSGVMFTRNPADGSSKFVINAHRGKGDDTMSGRNLPAAICIGVNRDTQEIYENEAGMEISSFPLDRSSLQELIRYGCEIEKLFGHPVDIEWIKGGRSLYRPGPPHLR